MAEIQAPPLSIGTPGILYSRVQRWKSFLIMAKMGHAFFGFGSVLCNHGQDGSCILGLVVILFGEMSCVMNELLQSLDVT
jgi:hypothetical protein